MNSPHRAVRVGETPFTWGKQKQFPFMYTFLTPLNHKQPEPGIRVASNAHTTHHVRTDPDFAFKLLWVKYSAYWKDTSGAYAVYRAFDESKVVSILPGDPAATAGDQLTNHLFVTLQMLSSGARTIVGSKNLQPWRNDTDALLENGMVPMCAGAGQGYMYGYGEVRTPYLCPKDGVMQFRLTNDFTEDLYVNAAIFGLKLRV